MELYMRNHISESDQRKHKIDISGHAIFCCMSFFNKILKKYNAIYAKI